MKKSNRYIAQYKNYKENKKRVAIFTKYYNYQYDNNFFSKYCPIKYFERCSNKNIAQ